MDYYMRSDDSTTANSHGLLSDTNTADTYRPPNHSTFSNPNHFKSDDSDLFIPPPSSSSSPLSSFSPLPPSLHSRLFPPTTLARLIWLILILLLIFLVLLTGYEIGKRLTPSSSSPSPSPTPSARSTVVLISIDGFRASYLDWYPTSLPTLRSMRWNGASARRMQSCYPSTTFPNHWSIVTGLYTDEHGIVSNNMYDPTLNASFNMQTLDSVWWGGEPVWNTAMKQNLRANVLFWPGSEVEVQGMRPNQWRPFDATYPNSARIDTLLWWIGNRSCDLCVSYFDLIDTAGHTYGPNPSPQLQAALAVMDGLVNQLMQGLYQMGAQDEVTVILVSDHGMSAINGTQRAIMLDDYTDVSQFRLIDMGAGLGIWPNDLSQTQTIYDQLYNKVPHLTVFDDDKKREMHYTGNHRIPPIVGVAEDGWVVRTRARPYSGGGTHGYDPRLQSMGALFVGQGKGLKKGAVVNDVDNVNVYSLICHLLGIVPAKTSGSLEVWRDILA